MSQRPHLWRPYTQMKTEPPPVRVVAAQGVHLHLEDGGTLIDGVSSWWTACHGHRHPHIVGAIHRQLDVMPHVMLGGIVHPQAETLAGRLAAWCPGDLDHVFFSESGSVSVEIAMKAAIQVHIHRGDRGRTRFVAFRGGYHGDTLATMSVCDPEEGMHTLFSGAVTEQLIADVPDTEARREALSRAVAAQAHTLAGVVIEPLVQGAGGMRFHDAEVLRFLRRLCDAHGLLLIADEIMTGFGRLGHRLATESAGVLPDLMTLSKALTGGTLPLAATIARRPVFDAFWSDDPEHALMHGPTYTGNALACAAAHASLDLFEQEPRLEQARAIEGRLREGLACLAGLPGVADVRCRGALGVVQLDRWPERDAWVKRFVDRGVWLRPFRDVVYCAPPLVIDTAELDQVIDAMVAVTRRWSREEI